MEELQAVSQFELPEDNTTNISADYLPRSDHPEKPSHPLSLAGEKSDHVYTENDIFSRYPLPYHLQKNPVHYGKYRRVLGGKYLLGPDWPYALCVSVMVWTSMLFSLYIALASDVAPAWMCLVQLALASLQQWSQWRLALDDPGMAALVKDRPQPTEDEIEYFSCRRCKLVRWKGVDHCLDCDVCIVDVDHHCPWSTKCVTDKNMRMFYVFVGSTIALIIFSLGLTMVGAFGATMNSIEAKKP